MALALTSGRAVRAARAMRLGWAVPVLAAAAAAVYAPALNRVFAADQINYFAELGGSTALADGLRHWDYAATRQYWKGDDALFRPVVMAWLAAGNRLFGYHHVGWNVATLALHVLVAVGLFRLLLAIRASPAALAGALVFLVMKPSLELPLWHHLGGYLIGCAAFTVAVRRLVLRVGATGPPPGLAVYAAAFTVAALSHESFVPASILAGVAIAAGERRRQRRIGGRALAALAAPALIFGVLYAGHLTRVERPFYADRADGTAMLDAGNVAALAPRSLLALGRWTLEAAAPSALRFAAAPFERLTKAFEFDWRSPLHLLNALLVAGLLGALGGWSGAARARGPTLLVLAGSAWIFAAVNLAGRSPIEVRGVAYYAYPVVLCLVPVVYGFTAGRRGWRGVLAAASVAGLIAAHALETAAVARAIGRANAPASAFLTRVARFVDAHRGEPGFSFALQPHPSSIDPEVHLKRGYPDDPRAEVLIRRFSQVVFACCYDAERPVHQVLRDGSAVRLRE